VYLRTSPVLVVYGLDGVAIIRKPHSLQKTKPLSK
jgi:hypothetical protein